MARAVAALKWTPLFVPVIRRLALLSACAIFAAGACAARQIALTGGPHTFLIDPASLSVEGRPDGGTPVHLIDAVKGIGPADEPVTTGTSAAWRLPHAGLNVEAGVTDGQLMIRITADAPGELHWPVVTPGDDVRALILPRGEGSRVPVPDAGWAGDLAGHDNAVTEEFSLPCFGLELPGRTVTCILPIPFNTGIEYPRHGDRLGISLRHTFTRLDVARQYGIVIGFGGPSPVDPALRYREWMIRHHTFVTLAEKVNATPRAERLAGALQAYIWGAYLRTEDVRDWKGLCAILARDGPRDPGSPAGRIWALLNPEARNAAREGAGANGPYSYLQEVIARELERIMQRPEVAGGGDAGTSLADRTAASARWLIASFPGHFNPLETWGDGVSLKFLAALTGLGVDRAVLVLGDLHSGDRRPDVAVEADRLGYLYGPYDDFESLHLPGDKNSWETAQFGRKAYDEGGVLDVRGKYHTGFDRHGRQFSSLAARPYVEARVRESAAAVPFSMWFVDGDAYGQWFDDYSPAHPGTQSQDLAARIDRMKWITQTFHIPVGSEGGSALAAGVVCYAHGMLTPAIGWDDQDLHNPKSKYYLGGYWPPEAPEVFFRQVPVKPKYIRPIYDPRYRLPLYEAALHDSVVATHQWGNGSLKFRDLQTTVALTELLYNVPPLYHLNLAELKREQGRIAAQYRFFSPLHRRLAYQAMTGFRALTDDRLVQETTFADGTVITANFRREPATVGGLTLPAESVTARSAGTVTTFRPGVDRVRDP